MRGGPHRLVEIRHRPHQEGEAVGRVEGADARTGEIRFDMLLAYTLASKPFYVHNGSYVSLVNEAEHKWKNRCVNSFNFKIVFA